MFVHSFSDTDLLELHVTASAATSSLVTGRTFELELALADVKQKDPAHEVNRLPVIASASKVWQAVNVHGQ